jgi:lipoprotein-anchoring transpeptidase ErfK/SrfK
VPASRWQNPLEYVELDTQSACPIAFDRVIARLGLSTGPPLPMFSSPVPIQRIIGYAIHGTPQTFSIYCPNNCVESGTPFPWGFS